MRPIVHNMTLSMVLLGTCEMLYLMLLLLVLLVLLLNAEIRTQLRYSVIILIFMILNRLWKMVQLFVFIMRTDSLSWILRMRKRHILIHSLILLLKARRWRVRKSSRVSGPGWKLLLVAKPV